MPTQNATNHDERYWSILQYNIDWLRFSESKATAILTVYGIILTIAYTNANSVFEAISKSRFIFWATIAYAISTIMSTIFSFLTLNPKLKNNASNSILYFGTISKSFSDAATYKAHAKKILDDDNLYTDQLAEQIYINSSIAWTKYKRVTWSLRFLFAGLFIIVISLVTYLIQNLQK